MCRNGILTGAANTWILSLKHAHGSQALRVLDNAMDTIIDKPDKPLKGWTILERDASGGRLMRWFAHLVYILRKVTMRHPTMSLQYGS